MPPQQGEKKFPGTDKRDSRFQVVTKESLLKSQLIFTGHKLNTGIQGKKNIKLNLLVPPKVWLELEQPWPSTEGFITLEKQIKIINLISCVLLKLVPHHDLQDRWIVLKRKKKKKKESNMILDKRRLY